MHKKTCLLDYSNKSELVAIPAVEKFVAVLAELIAGETFNHAYKGWHCDSLPDAKIGYQWHGDYLQNASRLRQLRKQIHQALGILPHSQVDEQAAFIAAVKVFDWGQVHKGCVGYVIEKLEQGHLASRLLAGIAAMDAENYNLARFDQSDLRMDSGLTKVYSLGAERSVIFDSRVCAALLLIATRCLSAQDKQELQRRWLIAGGKSSGKGNKRSAINHVQASLILQPEISRLVDGKKVLFPLQAHLNLTSNWILQAAVKKAGALNKRLDSDWQLDIISNYERLRAVEAALFMIGADISQG